jgi:hypothetical protein
MTEQTINITPTGSEIEYRTGELSAPYTPKVIEYKGNIEAPFSFFSARVREDAIFTSNDALSLSECILIVNHKNNTILLICGENQQNKVTVLGELKLNAEIEEIGINKPSVRRKVSDLRDWIKYNRKFLHPDCSFQETLQSLQKVNTAFTIKKSEEKNGSGNEYIAKQVIVDDLPKFDIIFNVRLFEGLPKVKIPVEVEAEVVNGELMFLFFSPEISTMIEDLSEKLLNEQVAAFDSQIAIIHQ